MQKGFRTPQNPWIGHQRKIQGSTQAVTEHSVGGTALRAALAADSVFPRIQGIVLLSRHGTPLCRRHTSSATGLQENLSCLPLIHTLNLDVCFLALHNHTRVWRLRKHTFVFYCPSQPGTGTQWVLVDCSVELESPRGMFFLPTMDCFSF